MQSAFLHHGFEFLLEIVVTGNRFILGLSKVRVGLDKRFIVRVDKAGHRIAGSSRCHFVRDNNAMGGRIPLVVRPPRHESTRVDNHDGRVPAERWKGDVLPAFRLPASLTSYFPSLYRLDLESIGTMIGRDHEERVGSWK